MHFAFISSVSQVSSDCLSVPVCPAAQAGGTGVHGCVRVFFLAIDRNILAIFVSCSL